MRVWTNGKAVFAWLPVGKLRLDLEDSSKSAFETGPDPDRRQADADADSELVALTPKKGKDLLDGYAGPEPIDAIAIDEKDIAYVVAGDEGPPELRIGAAKGKKPKRVITLSAQGKTVTWPERTMWAASAPPAPSTEREFGGAGHRAIRLAQSEHGLAVASGPTGHVGVLRPGGEDFEFVLRLPCHDEAVVHAVATGVGVLATLVVEDRHSLAVHLDPEGKLLGRWPDDSFGWGMTSLGLLGAHAVVYEDQSQSLSLLRLPDLAEEQRQGLATEVVDLATAADGRTFAVCSANRVVVGRLDPEEGRFSLDDPHSVAALIAYAQSDDAKRVPRYRPEPASDPTSVGFSALKVEGAAWKAEAGEAFEIALTFRSAGLAGRGIVVQVGGPAIDEGHLTIAKVRADDDEAELDEAGRAELPNVRLVQGVKYPLEPKPKKSEDKDVGRIALEATHFEIRLEGQAQKAGRPLFWVAVGASAGSTPVKRTRPFVVG